MPQKETLNQPVRFSIRDGQNIGFKFYVILVHRTEMTFPSYKNQKEKIFQGFC